MKSPSYYLARSWTLAIAAVLFAGLGTWALRLQAQQARDTIRKHDVEDLEQALFRYGQLNGSYPPLDTPTWCGTLSTPENNHVKLAVEKSLRHDEKYAKPDKPFPADPRYKGTNRDYFYWKTSPVSFELFAELEADPNDTRDTSQCGSTVAYDYSVVSTLRNKF